MRRSGRSLRALCIALVAIAAGTAVAPAAASAATLPGMPAWTSWETWWTKLLGTLTGAGWTLPGSGSPQPPSGGSGSPQPPSGGGTPTPGHGTTFGGTYTGAAGSRDFTGYVPSGYRAGTPMPLIVVLHGCTESADVIRQLTRFDQLAEAKGFIVAFPEQPQSANYQKCWNFFQDAHLHRGSGEPALIAGITGWVQQHYAVDPHRIYVAGLSAGGAMASVMAATYPDLYAAIGVGSGCEYAATATCAGYQSSDPAKAAQAAYAEMGARARPLPVIAFEGSKDTTVPPVNADQLVRQWLLTDDLADDRAQNGSVSTTPDATDSGQVPGGHAYTVRHYDGDLAQYWLVDGMSHAWSGGCSCEPYADPAGPDETAAMYAFFMSHPMS